MVLLWVTFLAVHAWLSVAVWNGPHTPLNDVSTVYRDWILRGSLGDGWVGVDLAWVYPTAALVPMLAAAAAGFDHYSEAWLVLVALLDAIALGVIVSGQSRRHLVAGFWWLAYLLALGPIAVGRIDGITVPLAIAGLLVAARHPGVAGVLLALATWIKVWPFALILAVVIAEKRRIRVLAAAATTSLAIVLAAVLGGGNLAGIAGFVGKQTGRGLQLEAPITTFWLWAEALGAPGVSTTFDQTLLTYQVTGPGSALAAAATTPIMVLVLLLLVALGIVATRRGAPAVILLPPLALALTTAFIVTNKVGSPQYEAWLAAPVVLGLATLGRRFTAPSILTVLIAGLTQVIYPWQYDALVVALPWMVVVATLRNVLLVALLVAAARAIVVAGRPGENFGGVGATNARMEP